ncbi:MAG: AI-2E family transporter [Rhodospirillaceae bacterium]|nr:AI-2E family transporter [Rhodospirillaceae bacterium]
MMPARPLRVWLAGLLLALLALWLLADILLPFVAGLALAYLLDPLCDRLERWGCSRTLATVLVTAAMLVALVAVLLLLVPLLRAQITALVEALPGYLEMLETRVIPRLEAFGERLGIDDVGDLRGQAAGQASQLVGWAGATIVKVFTSGIALFNLLSLVFITPVVTFYLLRDWDRLVARIDSWLPRAHAPVIREQARAIDRTLAGFVRGQAMVCLFLAVYNAAGLSLLGLEFGLAVGVLSGLLSFIPFVGTALGLVGSVGLAFAQFDEWWRIAAVAALFLVGQFLEGNVLSPKLVGARVGLHPVWVIFALLAGGALFGFVGLLLAVPAAAVIGVMARFALQRYLASRYYEEPALGGGRDAGSPP